MGTTVSVSGVTQKTKHLMIIKSNVFYKLVVCHASNSRCGLIVASEKS